MGVLTSGIVDMLTPTDGVHRDQYYPRLAGGVERAVGPRGRVPARPLTGGWVGWRTVGP